VSLSLRRSGIDKNFTPNKPNIAIQLNIHLHANGICLKLKGEYGNKRKQNRVEADSV